jgi:hypothetical protein
MSRQFPSEVIAETIDADYPVAGQDNDSQGFRDNFSVIKDGLATAKAELTDLQTNSARLDDNNNFGGYLIDNARTNRLYGTVYPIVDAGSINVDLANGLYQEITVTGTATLIIDGWPTEDVYASMKLAIKSSTATAYQVTLSAAGGSNKVFNSLPATGIVTVDDDLQIIDVWTIDQGATVYFKLDASPTISVIDNLTDVTITSPTNGQVLKYNGTAWVNGIDNVGDSLTLDNLTDVVITGTPTDGQVIVYDTATSKWINDVLDIPADVSDLTDTTNLIPADVSDLTDTTNLIPADLSDLTDTTNLIPADLSDLTDTTNLIPDPYYTGSEDLVDAGAADLTKSVSYFSTAAAETATLAVGTAGQVKTFAMFADVGDMVITVTNPAWGGAGTITFSAAGQACTLQYINDKWFCIGNNGAAFA